MSFVHLHLHSQYSLLDGAIRLGDLVERCGALGMDSVAVTDHGNLFGAVKFFNAAIKQGIKPIIGVECYLAPGEMTDRQTVPGKREKPYHLTLLAETNEGYRNLSRIVSLSYIEGFYYKPRIDKKVLREYSKGLIGLSGCIAAEIPRYLAQDQFDIAKAVLQEYLAIFGQDNFFIELMDHGLPEQEKITAGLVELASEFSLGLVATNDCHYLEKEDFRAHDVLLAIQTGKNVSDRDRLQMPVNEFYMKTPDEMIRRFHKYPGAISNTRVIADRCGVDLSRKRFHIPGYRLEGTTARNSDEYLEEKAFVGLHERYGSPLPEPVKVRAAEELAVIKRMEFADYFLVVWDLVNFARKEGIFVGPGRGSAAGSIVSYALRITDIDPLKHGLIFERFLNPARVTMPDIDIDFEDIRRDEIIRYLIDKYGRENVVKVITFQNLKARKVIKEVGRVMGISFSRLNSLTKLVPNELNITLPEAVRRVPELKELSETGDPEGEVVRIALRLEGLPGYPSTHAAGVVIGDEPLIEIIPLFKDTRRNEICTQFEKDAVEEMGLLKMDILGLRNLTIIRETLDLVKERHNKTVDWEKINYEDRETFNLLSRGEGIGVFQLESEGMRELLRSLQPHTFTDIIALIALYRPGPLGSNMVEDYVQRKHGRKGVEYPHPVLEPILEETYGVILYQEQVMQIASELGGFSMSEADELRKAMGKKIPGVMEKYRDKFIEGALQKKVERTVAERVFELMEFFAGYGFNKSHSAAYAVLAFQTAYLKAHYPLELMTAILNSETGKIEKVSFYIRECVRMGIKILQPDVCCSESRFVPEGKSVIRYGLGALKNVGASVGDTIAAVRKEKPFSSLEDFFTRVPLKGINRRVIESLVLAGAFDSLEPNRRKLYENVEAWLDCAMKINREDSNDQVSLFEGMEDQVKVTFPAMTGVPDWEEIPRLRKEKEILGLYLSGHPVTKIQEKYAGIFTLSLQDVITKGGEHNWCFVLVEEVRKKLDRRDKPMAIVKVSDATGTLEVMMFSSLFERVQDMVRENSVVFLRLRYDPEEGGRSAIAEDIFDHNDAEKYLDFLAIRWDYPRPELVSRLKTLLERSAGKYQVMIKCHNSKGEETKVRIEQRVKPHLELPLQIRKLIPESTVYWVLSKRGCSIYS